MEKYTSVVIYDDVLQEFEFTAENDSAALFKAFKIFAEECEVKIIKYKDDLMLTFIGVDSDDAEDVSLEDISFNELKAVLKDIDISDSEMPFIKSVENSDGKCIFERKF